MLTDKGLVLNGRVVVSVDDLEPRGQLPSLGLQYVLGGNEDQARQLDLPPGLWLFNQRGELARAAELPMIYLLMPVHEIQASPDNKTLAISFGNSELVWGFVSYPEFKELGSIEYDQQNPALVWLDNNTVALTVLKDDKTVRNCDYNYAPAGVKSVVAYNFITDKTTPLLPGSGLCDYVLKGFDGKNIIAAQICSFSPEQWNDWDASKNFEQVEVSVPYK